MCRGHFALLLLCRALRLLSPKPQASGAIRSQGARSGWVIASGRLSLPSFVPHTSDCPHTLATPLEGSAFQVPGCRLSLRPTRPSLINKVLLCFVGFKSSSKSPWEQWGAFTFLAPLCLVQS